MASVYLIRHGQASFGAENYDALSSLGEQQAQLVGKALFSRIGVPAHVLSGTMLRHQQTRDHALSAAEMVVEKPPECANWNEYDHQAVLAAFDARLATAAGTKEYLAQSKDAKNQFAQLFLQALKRWQSGEHDADYPESWLQFKARVAEGLKQLLNQLAPDDTAVVFTSGGPISAIAQSLLGLADKQMLSLNWTLANAGISKIVKTPNRIFLSTLNEHSHFEKPELRHMITYK